MNMCGHLLIIKLYKINSKHSDLPSHTDISETLSCDLKKHGFTFVGPTICYAFMQAVGMVNDHTVDCFKFLK